MNKTIILVLTAFLALFSVHTVLASGRPEACPSAEAITKAKLSFIAYNEDEDYYMAGAIGRFDTSQKWGILMGISGDQATTLLDALNLAIDALATVTGTPKPVPAGKRTYRCKYLTNKIDYPVIAITPINNDDNNTYLSVSKSVLMK